MSGILSAINEWFKTWSGIAGGMAALIIAIGVIYTFSGKLTGKIKRALLGDIYQKLDKIENNALVHIESDIRGVESRLTGEIDGLKSQMTAIGNATHAILIHFDMKEDAQKLHEGLTGRK